MAVHGTAVLRWEGLITVSALELVGHTLRIRGALCLMGFASLPRSERTAAVPTHGHRYGVRHVRALVFVHAVLRVECGTALRACVDRWLRAVIRRYVLFEDRHFFRLLGWMMMSRNSSVVGRSS